MIWLTLLVLLYAAAPQLSMAAESRAAIFMYSHFGVPKYPDTNISLKQFDAHLNYLEKNKYQIWPLAKIAGHIKNGLAIPDRTVAITLDDGHISAYQHAYPRLKKRGWPFTVFIYTDALDQRLKGYISWRQLREMHKHGASIANQSKTHSHLIRLRNKESVEAWSARVRADIEHAQQRIKEELGDDSEGLPMLFSYPYGEYNTALANIVQELGYVGIGEQSGPAGKYSDLRVLPRYPISEGHTDLEEFRVKASSLELPVTEVTPWDPVLKKEMPRMVVTLGESDANLNQLACLVSGQGRVKVKWLDKKSRRFAVRAMQPLRMGRSRYNCSAPSIREPDRQYWFSHLWIRNPAHVVHAD